MKESRFQNLITPFETDKTSSWETEYPRPQMKRESFMSLCGEWNLSVKKNGTEEPIGCISVPYPPESRISGIERELSENEKYIYEKKFTLSQSVKKERVLLHFGAVDQIARVFVNGHFAIEHIGGYTPFSVDITDYIAEENTVRVEVTDKLDKNLPYGKQSKNRGGMWYTPISGIWQSVWLEGVCENCIEKIKITPSINSVKIETVGGMREKRVIIGDKEYTYSGDAIDIAIDNPILWTPESPYLYYFTITDGVDEIESYFALRTISVENGRICLNGKPYFFHGLLDQGYYSDGIFTPATPQGYRYDILTAKKMGFNMLRKHIKIEPDVFYYYCDKYGMAVFQDAVNCGEYHYITDTVLPTIGWKISRDDKPTKRRKAAFEKTLGDMVENLYNHPSVCYWTIFNEGWGQYEADRIYESMKEKDPTRIWDATSGWFKKKKSDVLSEHVYFRPVRLKAKGDKPVILSEFGGYSYKIDENSFNLDETYGYKKFTDKKDFEEKLKKLYIDEIVPSVKNGLCGAVLTQISDVEDETNGLVTYDRQKVKVSEEIMLEIREEIDNAFEGVVI